MENKKKKKQLNLYQKEQLIIFLLLLCFVLSGFIASEIKNDISSIPTYITEDSAKETLETDSEEIHESADDLETNSEETTENTSTIITDEKDISSNSQTTKPSNNSSGSSTGSSAPSTSTQPEQKPSKEEEKVWVPPVYQTIHHDAVYQTVRIVVCNYCGAAFDTVGEFQVHKDANGG